MPPIVTTSEYRIVVFWMLGSNNRVIDHPRQCNCNSSTQAGVTKGCMDEA